MNKNQVSCFLTQGVQGRLRTFRVPPPISAFIHQQHGQKKKQKKDICARPANMKLKTLWTERRQQEQNPASGEQSPTTCHSCSRSVVTPQDGVYTLQSNIRVKLYDSSSVSNPQCIPLTYIGYTPTLLCAVPTIAVWWYRYAYSLALVCHEFSAFCVN